MNFYEIFEKFYPRFQIFIKISMLDIVQLGEPKLPLKLQTPKNLKILERSLWDL